MALRHDQWYGLTNSIRSMKRGHYMEGSPSSGRLPAVHGKARVLKSKSKTGVPVFPVLKSKSKTGVPVFPVLKSKSKTSMAPQKNKT